MCGKPVQAFWLLLLLPATVGRCTHTFLRTAAATSPALIRDLPTPVLAPHTQTDGSCRGTCTLASLLLHLLVGLLCCCPAGDSSERTGPLRCLERAMTNKQDLSILWR